VQRGVSPVGLSSLQIRAEPSGYILQNIIINECNRNN